jgi:hypothetical protein
MLTEKHIGNWYVEFRVFSSEFRQSWDEKNFCDIFANIW